MMLNHPPQVAVIGLGYVGLPLAVAMAKHYDVVGFDICTERVSELQKGVDNTGEVSKKELLGCSLAVTTDPKMLAKANIYIVTVPTPINRYKQPDLSALIEASRLIGEVILKGDIVIYESTVYPGATEEDCIPEIEKVSGLTFNKDFFAGYSPERINPGDKTRKLTDIKKVTSGSTEEVASYIDQFYAKVVTAGTHLASSIKVAEAAKVIENTQRDLNIALMNELAIIFSKMDIDTQEVLEAAATKWNFLPFTPGLVGGHCIGVDPYYLTHKSESLGYRPEVILAGRRINDGMPAFIASQVIKKMLKKRIVIAGSRILILGLTFKENCPDTRNTRVKDLVREFIEYGMHVDIYDPLVKLNQSDYLVSLPQSGCYDAVVLAVAHEQFLRMGEQNIHQFGKANAVFYDVKSVFSQDLIDGRL